MCKYLQTIKPGKYLTISKQCMCQVNDDKLTIMINFKVRIDYYVKRLEE